MVGKHVKVDPAEELTQRIGILNREIDSLRSTIVDVLSSIVDLNESNNYGSPEARRRLITEVCKDTIKELDKPSNQI